MQLFTFFHSLGVEEAAYAEGLTFLKCDGCSKEYKIDKVPFNDHRDSSRDLKDKRVTI